MDSVESGSATATISESDPVTISITGPTSVDEGDATSSVHRVAVALWA